MTEKIFNSLEFKKFLEKVGVPTPQAEKHIEIMGKIINTHLATKDDLKIASLQLRAEMTAEFTKVYKKIEQLEQQISFLYQKMDTQTIELKLFIEEALARRINTPIIILGAILAVIGTALSLITYFK